MEKPFGTDLASAHEAERRSCTRSSTRTRSSGSTTSSARRRPRTSWPSGSPTGCSSRSGTATTSTTSRSTCPRRSASTQRASTSTRRPAPTATWWSPTCSRCWPSPRWSRPTALEPLRDQRGEEQGLPLDAADRAARRRARPVRRLPRHRGRRATTPRPRRSSPSSASSTTGAGPACRSTCAPASGWPRAPGSSRSRSASRRVDVPAGLGRRRPRPRPPHLRPRRPGQDVAVLLRQAARPGHAARQAVDAVRDARDRLGRRRARGLRAADLRRRPRRPHPVHLGRRHRAALGDLPRRCWRTRPSCGPTRRARGAPTRSTS